MEKGVKAEQENLVQRLKRHRERLNLLHSTFTELKKEEANVLATLKNNSYQKKIKSASTKTEKSLQKLSGTKSQLLSYMNKLNEAFKLGYKEIMAVRKEFFPNQELRYKILDYQSNGNYRDVTLNETQYLENLKDLDISSYSSIEKILQQGKLIENLTARVKSYSDINKSLSGDKKNSKFENINNAAITKIIKLTPRINRKITIKSGETIDIPAYNRARGYEAYYNIIFYLKTKRKAKIFTVK